ncbi:MAG: FKBP-type peptidyl-prolyl cis-trans isomerase [Candidatus Limnocylindrales bacterium]
MNKTILIIIIAVIVLAVLWGIYLVVANMQSSGQQPQSQTGQSNSPDMQGMKVTVLKEGTGTPVKNGDIVKVNYIGTLQDGTKFDSSYDRKIPFTFTLGAHQVIKGWDLGVLGMKLGEKRQLVIPPALAYGQSGIPIVIPKNATLTFQIELLQISPPKR